MVMGAASLVVLWALGGLGGVNTVQIALWCAALAAAVIFWSGLAMVVNSASWPSAANAAALLMAWLAFVVVLPAVIGEAANAWEPVPSRVQLINAIREAGNLTPADASAMLSTYYEEHPDAQRSKNSADVTAIRGLAQQDEVDRRIDPIVAAYRTAVARQQAIARWLRFVTPPLLVHDAIAELAANTGERAEEFARQVDDYHGAWRRYFYPLVHAKATLTMRDYDAAPRFAFREEPTAVVRSRVLRLLSVTAVFGAAALFSGQRRI
jgi:ABC-2 type transport system permease protein